MKTTAKWAKAAEVHVLDAECRDGGWIVSGLGLGHLGQVNNTGLKWRIHRLVQRGLTKSR